MCSLISTSLTKSELSIGTPRLCIDLACFGALEIVGIVIIIIGRISYRFRDIDV